MDIRVPQLAEGVDSATVVNILVSEGDRIEKEQSIMELETQKAVGAIPSPEAGTVTKIHVKQGDEVAVGEVLISLSEEAAAPTISPDKDEGDKTEKKTSAPDQTNLRPKPEQRAQIEEGEKEETVSEDYKYESKSGFAPPASPSIRKMARELGIDLSKVKGSERGGRITLHDLRAYIQRLQEMLLQQKATPPKAQKPALESIDFSKWGPIHKKRMSSLRRIVAQRMYESWSTIPHITQFDEADITSLSESKKKYTSSYEKKGARLTLTSYVLKAAIVALKKHPIFNSSLDESTGEIVYKEYYHLGVAVDTEAGLIVPVIKDVDKKGMLDLSIELGELAERTRQRKVSLEELQGGTFTVSNQGSIGGTHFTPIIRKPEVAILGLGQAALKPVVKKQRVEPRMILPVCLSYDHRVIDGANAARFIREIVQVLENFDEEVLRICIRGEDKGEGG
jgi:pyruvate dehydrogenase E2 component (dihydrolipoamide acetyltransferase)